MIRRNLWPVLALVLLVPLAACYPGGPESAEDTGLTVTAKVPGADYSDLQTFAMEDNIILLDRGTDPEPLPDVVNEAILDQLRASMVAAGFQDVSPDTATVTPDVWVVVGANQAEVWFYYQGWGYYGGWYNPGWGYYPPYVGVSSFQAGSVVWGLADMREIDPAGDEEELRSIWYAGLNGALSNSDANTATRVRNGIKQAFVQSPYINGTPTKQEDGS